MCKSLVSKIACRYGGIGVLHTGHAGYMSSALIESADLVPITLYKTIACTKEC